ncbi:hypothetical protein TNCV_626971 [Trichonephila clavipes]|nr:hypothetical protein TNCV_626971 [Trichonephila clavipes]
MFAFMYVLEDDIEIISENEVSEIPSHSPDFPQKHACRKKLFSGKRSLPVLPCVFFGKNGKKDDKVEVENRSSPVVPFSIFQKKVENALVISGFFLISHFNNNKEEWLASKNDSGKGLSTESASEKGLCSKDGSGKFLLLEKKLSQWLSPKENPGNSSFWLSENPHQCSAKI